MFTSDMIELALEEDIGHGDITSDATVDPSLRGIGRLKAKEGMVVCGLGVFGAVFAALDSKVHIQQHVEDGYLATSGDLLVTVESTFMTLLKAERVALNFIQRLSGIATLTREYVKAAEGTSTKILDTRKTTPLYRHLEKYAVKVGGGINHRFGLFDQILIKDNHIAACGGSVAKAVQAAKKKYPQKDIVIEVCSIDQAKELMHLGVKRFLLDNMNDQDIQACVELLSGNVETEASGGITVERVSTLARLGVDYISVGALTHSVRAADLHFKIERVQ